MKVIVTAKKAAPLDRRRRPSVTLQTRLIIIGLLVIATTLEVTGDALIRNGLTQRALTTKTIYFVVGAVLVFGYGVTLNLAPIAFHKVAGIYIAVLFIVWQAVSYVAYREIPQAPTLIGGAMIIIGGLIVAFWQPGEAL
jgi:drug/metabolite transporter (DMT)-like permease